jgi:Tol biopolymer transport system component
MNKHFRSFTVFLLAFVISACASPAGIEATQPSASDQVETIVASTMQALIPARLLPHALYFVSNDDSGIAQVYRLETDGKTVKQITLEPVAVGLYDVSLADGSVAYVANNQLLLVNADGSNRHVLVDGGLLDPNNRMTSLHHPIFSPDGKTIAYAHNGLNLYNVATGVSRLVLQDAFSRPVKFSPDGLKLLMTISPPNTDATHDVIYYPATNSIVRFDSADGAFFCCGEEEWTQDSLSFYAANPTVGMLSPGLWRVDAASGNVTTLLPTETGDGNYNLADKPYLAPDSQLYYFFLESKTVIDGTGPRAPLQLVRSAPDGVTDRTVLRPDTFELMNEALWAPDASFVIVAKAPSDSVSADSVVELYYTDRQKSMVPLAIIGRQMKWGP